MSSHIIDGLRPETPEIDPVWEQETLRTILAGRGDARVPGRFGTLGRLVRPVSVAAAIAVLVAGLVVARSHLPASDVRPAGPVPTTVQTIDPSDATVLTLGDGLDGVADLPRTFGDQPVFFSSYAGEGVLVGDVSPEPQGDLGQARQPVLVHSFPVMYDLRTKEFTILDDRSRPEPTQVVDVSGDADTVVWAELVGMNVDTSTFSLYAYDRRSGDVTTMGTFDDPDGQIVYGNDLALSGDTAYFSTRAYPQKKGQGAVYAVPIDGSAPPRVVAAGGSAVRLSGDTMTYQVKDPDDRDAYPRSFTYDLGTRTTSPQPVSSHVDDPGFCGAERTEQWQTWCVTRPVPGEDFEPAFLTIEETSGRTTRFEPFPIGALNSHAPHDVMTLGPWTAITLTTDDGQDREFLVDLDTKAVKVFPKNTSFTALSPDRSTALISSFAGRGPGPQRLVRIPGRD
jgi:hypothetical protein